MEKSTCVRVGGEVDVKIVEENGAVNILSVPSDPLQQRKETGAIGHQKARR